MSQTHKPPLPLNALRAFDAVMRLGSMTRAAEALGVTHGAVSRQIQALQQELGVALFDGPRNARQPTLEGRKLWEEVGPAFDRLDQAMAGRSRAARPLRVSCLSTLAGRWLIPRLARWEHGAEVELTESYADLDRSLEGADLAIRMLTPGVAPPPGLEAAPFMRNRVGPVAAPGIDLVKARRLLPRSFPQAITVWTGRSGQMVGDASEPRLFDHQQTMIEACLAGLGVCVTQWPLVETDLASGRLVSPHGFDGDGAHFAVFHRQGDDSRAARRFTNWLIQQAGVDAPQAQVLPRSR